MGIYLIRNRKDTNYSRQIAICAENRINAVQILLSTCELTNDRHADIQVIEELNSGSHTVCRVYLNDRMNTTMEFVVTG